MSGGKSKEVTVGYKYLLGMHVVVSESPVDALLELAAGDRTFWAGRKASGRIQIDKPELFGGQAREGGVGGYVDVESGASDQTANDYLSDQLGGLTPAFRGVFALIFRRFYWGNNPYFQPLRVKVQSILQTFGNWLPGIAPMNTEENFERVAIHISIDQSLSMDSSRQLAMKDAMRTFINRLPYRDDIAVRFLAWGGAPDISISRFGTSATVRDELISFINNDLGGAGGLSGTDFEAATSGVADFFTAADAALPNGDVGFQEFNGALVSTEDLSGEASGGDPVRRVFVMITDGEPVPEGSVGPAVTALSAIPRIETFGINIVLEDTTFTAQIDAVGGDGFVPVVTTANPEELSNAIFFSFSSFADLNGVHILRDVLINPRNGGPGDASMIGASWQPAAELAFREGLGFSFRWTSGGEVDKFKQSLERHLDCSTWFDPVTNKYEIKMIRPDYTVGELTTFGVGGVPVVEWQDPEFPDPAGLPNQVVVNYIRRSNGEKAAVTVTNVAAVAASGIINSHKTSYEGVSFPATAAKIAQRDLIAKSQPIVKGAFTAAYLPVGLNLGSAIIVNEPRIGLDSMVVRITELEESDGVDNSVLVRFAQDVWAADLENDDVFVVDEPPAADDTGVQPPNVTFAEELPYFELVRTFTEKEVNEQLALDDGYAQWGATADRPNSLHFECSIVEFESASSVWLERASAPLAPAWALRAPLVADAAVGTFTAAATGREDELEVGQIIQINSEMMRVDAVAVAASVATFTVGRGVLDTVPAHHDAGDYAIVWPDFIGSDLSQYTEGQTVDLKVLTKTATDVVALGAVDTQTITFAARADRPYPVGRLRINGSYLPVGVQAGTLTATWAHRDRLTQTYSDIDDHTATSIGPEAGVSYIATERDVYLREDIFAEVGSPVSPPGTADFFNSKDFFLDDVRGYETEEVLSPAQTTTHDFDLSEPSPSWPALLARKEFGIKTVRGTSVERENWQTPRIMVSPLLPPLGLTGEEIDGGTGGSGSGSGSSATVGFFGYTVGSTQTITTATEAKVTAFTTSEVDDGSFVSGGEFTCPAVTGTQYVQVAVGLEGTITGETKLRKSTDGGSTWQDVASFAESTSVGTSIISLATMIDVQTGHKLAVFHDSDESVESSITGGYFRGHMMRAV